MRFTLPRRPDPLIDVTPMIDIVFQLVLFFMVSTTFVSSPGIQVDLPRSSQQVVISDRDDLNVWITADGAVFVNDQPVDAEGLALVFERTADRAPDTLVVVKADTGVDHGRVVAVMDRAIDVGLERIAIATDASGRPADAPPADGGEDR